MKIEQILSNAPKVLSQFQRKTYFEQGYLFIEGFIIKDEVQRLLEVTQQFVERSCTETLSGPTFDLAPSHSSNAPKIRRLKCPDTQHDVYWQFAMGKIADVAVDLVGPDVVFHHSKLNFKWNDGRDEVQWHQDIQFYPHTNYSSLTIGMFLEDTVMDDGAVAVLPKSHEGPLYDLYNDDNLWVGHLKPADIDRLDVDTAQYLNGPAGSITVHNCRTVHSSLPSKSTAMRPLLLNTYNAADAKPYTPHPYPSTHAGELVRGQPVRWVYHDPRPCLLPPDWSGGYSSIFAAQAEEEPSNALVTNNEISLQ